MFALTLIIAFAVASAAPRHHRYDFARNVFEEDVSDTRRIWGEMKSADVERVAAFGDIRLKLPDLKEGTEVAGNNYVIKIDAPMNRLWKLISKSCPGYLKILVVYKSREGFVTTTTYVDLTRLPPNVDPARAMWGYMDGVMTINFPYIEAGQTNPATDDRKGVEFMTDDGEDTNVVMTTTTEKNEEEDHLVFEPNYY